MSACYELTLFYDSQCPLCVAEMKQLSGFDHARRINIVDIQSPSLIIDYPMIDVDDATDILHGLLPDGRVITGLDVTCRAWQLVGRHRWLKLLRLPVMRQLSDLVYLLFARYRYSISWLLTGRARCEACRIDLDTR